MAHEPVEVRSAFDVLFFDDGAFAVLGDPLQLLD